MGELGEVWLQGPVPVAPVAPAVIQDDMVVAQIAETIADNELGGAQQQIGADIAGKGVPVVLASSVRLLAFGSAD